MAEAVVRFDGQVLFGPGTHRVAVGSRQREQVQHNFGGLDGTLSVDLGERQRTITQTGTLIAQSVSHLEAIKAAIETYIDGMVYALVDQDGQTYEQVRMDRFAAPQVVVLANQVRCNYEIHYTQLRP